MGNLGQSIFTLALFGVNAKGIVVKVKYYVRKLLYGREQIMLPPWEDLDQTTRAVSTMFIKHHMESCMSQVLHDLTVNMRLHRAVVTGQELVTWLQERGLVLSRQDGEVFGRHLLRGRVLRHVDNHLDFYDDRCILSNQWISSYLLVGERDMGILVALISNLRRLYHKLIFTSIIDTYLVLCEKFMY